VRDRHGRERVVRLGVRRELAVVVGLGLAVLLVIGLGAAFASRKVAQDEESRLAGGVILYLYR